MPSGEHGEILEFTGSRAGVTSLPKRVRFLGSSVQTDLPTLPARSVYEFEVITGNAAYREGERFYLTPAKANIYFNISAQGRRSENCDWSASSLVRM